MACSSCLGTRPVSVSLKEQKESPTMPADSSAREIIPPSLPASPMRSTSPQELADTCARACIATTAPAGRWACRSRQSGPAAPPFPCGCAKTCSTATTSATAGFMATLADSTFAFACNSYNELTVASGFAVDFLAPARLDDLLTASCVEVSSAGRTGVYDVRGLQSARRTGGGVPRPIVHPQGQARGRRLSTSGTLVRNATRAARNNHDMRRSREETDDARATTRTR